jgi:hypothetical protein
MQGHMHKCCVTLSCSSQTEHNVVSRLFTVVATAGHVMQRAHCIGNAFEAVLREDCPCPSPVMSQ